MPARHRLDQWARPELRLFGRERSSFQLLGFAGFFVGAALGLLLAAQRGLSAWTLATLALVAAGAFMLLAIATKLLLGHSRFVFYHHALALFVALGGYLWLTGTPPLPYLDVAALGLGAFLVFGRLGCFMVGCCFGQPHPLGVAYGARHVAAGFDDCLAEVRLFPTQLVEALWTLALVVGLSVHLWLGAPAPGATLAAFVALYAAGRFVFELTRGDAQRPIVAGFSEAQWTSLLLVGALALATRLGWLPAARWRLALAVALPFVAFFVAGWRFLGRASRQRLWHPAHVREVAAALRRLDQLRPQLAIATTSLGVQLSLGRIADGDGAVDHITVSQAGATMAPEQARLILELVERLRPPSRSRQLAVGRPGIFHLLLQRAA